MSKIPPQLRQSLSALLQTATAFAFRHLPGPQGLEDFLACRQHFVQRFLKVSSALGKGLAYLRNILFKALLDLFSEELFQCSIAKPFRVLGGMVRDDVRDEGAREPLGALIGIFREEGIERTARVTVRAEGGGAGRRRGCWTRRCG